MLLAKFIFFFECEPAIEGNLKLHLRKHHNMELPNEIDQSPDSGKHLSRPS